MEAISQWMRSDGARTALSLSLLDTNHKFKLNLYDDGQRSDFEIFRQRVRRTQIEHAFCLAGSIRTDKCSNGIVICVRNLSAIWSQGAKGTANPVRWTGRCIDRAKIANEHRECCEYCEPHFKRPQTASHRVDSSRQPLDRFRARPVSVPVSSGYRTRAHKICTHGALPSCNTIRARPNKCLLINGNICEASKCEFFIFTFCLCA